MPLTAWLAHELWPRWRWAAPVGALGAVLMPAVFAGSLYFHPDPPFAAFGVLATALVVRALRTGLTVPAGSQRGSRSGRPGSRGSRPR